MVYILDMIKNYRFRPKEKFLRMLSFENVAKFLHK